MKSYTMGYFMISVLPMEILNYKLLIDISIDYKNNNCRLNYTVSKIPNNGTNDGVFTIVTLGFR